VKLTIELDREDDGRWIAEVIELRFGKKPSAAPSAWRSKSLPIASLTTSFTVPDEQLARK
jgi:hypothetical protein